MKKKSKLKVSIFEIIAYSVCGAVGLWGLTYITLGLLARFLPVHNALAEVDAVVEKAFGLGLFLWGIIILAIATVVASFILLINAKKNDREVERETRRAARLAQMKNNGSDLPIVDAEVTPKKEEATPKE
ncbi:MAG TPA: hypothetical protein PLY58_01485 [Bacilli bacterium]|nr:hypothetical protein [Bacilli bacterium]HPY79816.1 hypothetical protein [Bacilli bacterium]HQA55748.1 hypothetical protein [Bacilli bacterium]